MVTLTYNPENGTKTGIMYIPMQPTIMKFNPHSKEFISSQNEQPKMPAIQRTLRQKPHNYTRLMILDDTELQDTPKEQDIVAEPEKEPKIPDSMFKRRMRPYMTSGQRHSVKQKLNKLFIGTSGSVDNVDEEHFQMVSQYTPRARQFNKVARNILTLPEYQQRKKEIARFGAQMTPNKNNCLLPKDCITQFDNAIKMNGAEIFVELNFNPTR